MCDLCLSDARCFVCSNDWSPFLFALCLLVDVIAIIMLFTNASVRLQLYMQPDSV